MENRPTLKIQETPFQKWMNWISMIILAISAIYLVVMYQKLPSEVPMHFNISGDVDYWGPKWTIFILWSIGLVLYFINKKTQSLPHKYNYIVKITVENARKQYELAIKMMSILKLELMLLIAYLLWSVVENAKGTLNNLNTFVMLGFLICLFSTLMLYLFKSRKYR
jgi:uncharacterized membrane protein